MRRMVTALIALAVVQGLAAQKLLKTIEDSALDRIDLFVAALEKGLFKKATSLKADEAVPEGAITVS